LEPFFKVVNTSSKNQGSKHGNINLANNCIADALGDMEKWITKGYWNNGGGEIFLNFRDILGK
jgi:hypothetical protein